MPPSSPVLHSYRVVVPFLAVHAEPERMSRFVELSAGTTISTMNDLHEPGLVVIFRGTDAFLVFARDLLERSELVETAEWAG